MSNKYVAFLRGINVGGHHKVPMADLRREMTKLGFEDVVTLLNSGNIVFKTATKSINAIAKTISDDLEVTFGFPIAVIVRTGKDILGLIESDPFKKVSITKDTRRYVSFLGRPPKKLPRLPATSKDKAFRIVAISSNVLCSVLDLKSSGTIQAMAELERLFGKEITTRNWNTIIRIGKSLT